MSPTENLRVFISSKDEMEDERSTVEDALADMGMTPVRVETHKWLATGQVDENIKQVSSSHLMILVLELLDPVVLHDDEYYEHVGMEVETALAEGKTVLAFVKESSPQGAVDEFLAQLQHRVFHRRFRNCVELRKLVRQSVLEELSRRYKRRPRVLKSRREMYEYAANSFNNVQQRLYMCMATPIQLLGPRKNKQYEKLMYDAFFELVKRVGTAASPAEVVIIFDLNAAEAELRDNANEYDTSMFRENLRRLRAARASNLYIIAGTDEVVPFVVMDHTYAIGHALRRRILAVVDTNTAVVDEFRDMVMSLTSDEQTNGLDAFEGLLDQFKL